MSEDHEPDLLERQQEDASYADSDLEELEGNIARFDATVQSFLAKQRGEAAPSPALGTSEPVIVGGGAVSKKVVDAPEIKTILGDGEDKLLILSGALSAGPGIDDSHGTKPPKSTAAVNLTTLGTSTEQPEAEMAIDFSPLALLVSSLYNRNYKTFFKSLAEVEEQFLNQDRYLHKHKNWFIREMRLRAYQQLLHRDMIELLESDIKTATEKGHQILRRV
ncbi:hypothetical protein FAVG1_12846 [Fusarium avenaceum]|nr:hypothetical protein FAVG1_12846 [Fusarium avenaceum]